MVQKSTDPFISIWMVTYNHAKFIKKALDSILTQDTSHSFKLIIGDDCSTDETQTILKEYKSKYPSKIELILNNENIGPSDNAIKVYESCNGKYTAMCEGDDYWTDRKKLEKQIKYLEENPNAVGCFHNSICVDEHDHIVSERYFKLNHKKSYNQEAVIKELHSTYSTAALVFRTYALKREFDFFKQKPSDFMLDCVLTNHGSLSYLEETMSAYRIHSSGIWQGSTLLSNSKISLERYIRLYDHLEYRKKYNQYLWSKILEHYNRIIAISDDPKERKVYKTARLKFINFLELRSYKYLLGKVFKSLRKKSRRIVN